MLMPTVARIIQNHITEKINIIKSCIVSLKGGTVVYIVHWQAIFIY